MSTGSSPAPFVHGRLYSNAAALPRRAAIGLLAAYQAMISPLLGPRCRFVPSCSAYTAEAIQRYGLLAGLWQGAWRLARCHPFHPGGFDPLE